MEKSMLHAAIVASIAAIIVAGQCERGYKSDEEDLDMALSDAATLLKKAQGMVEQASAKSGT